MASSARPLGRVRGANPVDGVPPVRRPPGLHDVALTVAPDGGLAPPDRLDVSLSASDLVSLVQRAGASDCDLRILTPPGEQNLPMLRAVARRLGRDVLIAPPGSEVVRLPGEPSTDGTEPPDDLVAVDAVSGYPVDWLAVQPSGQVGSVFGWFDLVGGLVAPRTGLVALPLADGGRMLATRETFIRARAAATTLRAGHPDLLTIGVEVRSGDFVLGFYDRRTVLADGTGLAAALSALPLYRAHVRMWLRWPTGQADRDRLRRNLAEFAEVTGATVWAPEEAGEVVMLDGCLDLAALDTDGAVGRWQPYGPANTFECDVDGRLAPVGGVTVAHLHAVRLVSGHRARERELARRAPVDRASGGPGSRAPAGPEPFTCDLAVLADGRLAVRHRDGTLLAVGGRQFAELLDQAGWTGSDVVLLSEVAPEQTEGAQRHLADLMGHLGVQIRLGHAAAAATPATTTASTSAPTPPSAPAPPPAWAAAMPPPLAVPLPPAVPAQAPVPPLSPVAPLPSLAPLPPVPRQPAVPLGPPRPSPPAVPAQPAPQPEMPAPASAAASPPVAPQPIAPQPEPRSTTRRTAAAAAFLGPADDEWVWESDAEADDPFGPLAGPIGRTRVIDGPPLMTATATPRHGLAWIPAQPQTNAVPFDVFVACDPDPGSAIVDGVPSQEPFLTGHLDADLLAERTTAAHLLQVRVAPGGAIDVAATEVAPPGRLAQVLSPKDVYVLPPGWLTRCEIVATYRITRDHAAVRQSRHTGVPLLLRPVGADHGVAGLPASAARWPHARMRGVNRFAVVADRSSSPAWLALLAERPAPTDGADLLELRVERNQAIDVAATAAALAELPAVRSTAAELLAGGVEVLLPAAAFAAVTVRKAWRGDGAAWRETTVDRALRLDAWLRDHQVGSSR